ncbi:MAG: type III secretion system inner membrane ring subunit SctD [Desulfovibrio sp.]|nr:type III secretion system inner membrane ring subunit SctD [Desulfovibrio sp.]
MSEEASHRAAAVATLHVFSGVHLGARIELTPGSWLLGSDDACDLILNGLSPRHAELRVSMDETGNAAVTVLPKEGRVIVAGVEVSEEGPLEAGAPWYLGETCFAWNLPGVAQEYLIPQRVDIDGRSAKIGTETSAEAVNAEADSVAPTVDTDAGSGQIPVEEGAGTLANSPLSVDDNQEATSAGFQPVRMDGSLRPRTPLLQRLRHPGLLLFLAILLCALSVVFSTGPRRSEYPTLVNNILAREHLTGFAVTPRWPGVEVRGAVASAADLERLQKAVQEVSFPVYLEVAVDDDMVRAVQNALGVRGFFPAVHMERSAAEPHLMVAVFMRDALVEADAFVALEKDVPSPPVKERRVVHEKEAAPFVLAALQNVGFSDIQPVYLPGRISLTGNVSPDRQPTLERLKSGLSAHFGVPLFGEGVLDDNAQPVLTHSHGATLTLPGQPRAGKDKQESSEVPRDEGDALGGLSLTGVYAAPLDFISTEDGKCLFPGAVLPNGNVLENITTSTLTLRRGDRVFTYSLRGKHE